MKISVSWWPNTQDLLCLIFNHESSEELHISQIPYFYTVLYKRLDETTWKNKLLQDSKKCWSITQMKADPSDHAI